MAVLDAPAAVAAGRPPVGLGLLPGWLLPLLLLALLGSLLWGLRHYLRARRLQASERRLQTLMANMPGALVTADEAGTIESFNPAAERIFGYAADEVVGANVRILMPEPHRSQHDGYLQRYRATGEAHVLGLPAYEVMGLHRDGHTIPLRMSLSEVDLGGRRQFVSILRDFTAQKQLEHDLARESRFANSVINSLPGVFYLLDQEMRFHRWNRNFELVSGYSAEEISTMRSPDFFRTQDHQRLEDAIGEVFASGQATLDADFVTKTGDAIPYFWTGYRVELDGGVFLAGMGIDISERKALERELRRRATTDALTGIPNRLQFEHSLQREIAKAERYGRAMALIMFDLDHFKAVNDHNGHEVGDRVLQAAVEVVRPLLRAGDLVARWGGEEFMVLAPETGGDAALDLAERLRGALEANTLVAGAADLTASFGVAELASGETPDQLVRRVDDALYRAKQGGRNRAETDPPWLG
jgi:diguanylate cyclase (GGDEF)-like protein/PAS domain S-box-containing protein